MADLSVTIGDVLVADTVRVSAVEVGEAISAGDVIVYDANDEDWVLASNASAALSGNGNNAYIGIAVGSAAAGQRVAAVINGAQDITLGSVLTAGRVYVLSTGGNISPESDAATNDWLTILGYAKSSTVLHFNPISTNVQVG